MIRCRSCLIPNTRPDTAFVDGVCSACVNFGDRPKVDWVERKRRLECVLEAGKNGSGFDCIVPSSGGKDSHYQTLELIKLGARPLVVTASTCHLTPIGRRNIDNLARHATTVEVTPNREVRRKLNKFGLFTVGDISYPEHMAIFSIPFQMAVKFGIPLILYGESPQREYGCPSGAEEAMTMTRRWVHEFGGLLGLRANDCVGYDGITDRDMMDYLLPREDFMGNLGIQAHFLGQYIPWDSHRNAKIAVEAGMEQALPTTANWWMHENLDNAMTGLHDHQCYRKYGFGRASVQLSVDIRHGKIDRLSALAIAKVRDGRFPETYADVSLESVLHRLKLKRSDLMDAIDKFTNWSLFKSRSQRPMLNDLAWAA